LAEIDFSREHRDRAVGIDRKEGIDLFQIERSSGGAGHGLRQRLAGRRGQGEGDRERAAAPQQRAAGKLK
jgi:hypothetical protein